MDKVFGSERFGLYQPSAVDEYAEFTSARAQELSTELLNCWRSDDARDRLPPGRTGRGHRHISAINNA